MGEDSKKQPLLDYLDFAKPKDLEVYGGDNQHYIFTRLGISEELRHLRLIQMCDYDVSLILPTLPPTLETLHIHGLNLFT